MEEVVRTEKEASRNILLVLPIPLLLLLGSQSLLASPLLWSVRLCFAVAQLLGLLAKAERRASLCPEGVEANDGLPGRLQGGQLGRLQAVLGHKAVNGQVGLEDVRLEPGQLLHLHLQQLAAAVIELGIRITAS